MRNRAKLGMALFVFSEAVFFFLLIVAYIYFRGESAPVAAANLHLGETAVFTACLLASSVTMWLAARTGSRVLMAATIALGLVFLIGQGSEYFRLYAQNVTINQSLFGTTFFTLTGFHGLHVAIGILALVILLPAAQESMAVETVALYWQFVDLVWLAIFSVVYLWGLL